MAYAPTAFAAAPFGYDASIFGQQSVLAQQPVFAQQPVAFAQPADFTGLYQQSAFVQQPVVYEQPAVVYGQQPVVYEQPAVVFEQQPVIYEQPVVQPVVVAPTVAPQPTITNRGPPNVPVPTWTRKRDPSYAHPELFLTGVGNGLYQQFGGNKKSSRYPFHHPGI